MSQPLTVTKASGELAVFDRGKFMRSLLRAGASEADASAILDEVLPGLPPGIRTRDLFRRAYARLRQRSRGHAARYKLKRAILELGPSGFPFERYIGELMRHEGFEVQTGQLVQGRCVLHEVDVLARRPGEQVFVECKFGNTAAKKLDLKTALYVHARVLDLGAAARAAEPGLRTAGRLVTNGAFTTDAIQYANCAGLELISWEHPAGSSLKDRIDRSALYPVTSLSSLTVHEKRQLLSSQTVLCTELTARPETLAALRLSRDRTKKLQAELEQLCAIVSAG
ncbi:MAG: restriction endonuclease [Bacteroidia bacterium]|nr:restriction endonuclease [Bacteroidia bacterium]